MRHRLNEGAFARTGQWRAHVQVQANGGRMCRNILMEDSCTGTY